MRQDEGAIAAGNRERIMAAVARLLSEGGAEAVSTRAVSAAAGVQPPTIYRLFGDKQGLLDAVAADGFRDYLASKRTVEVTDDPVDDLRAGWDTHIGFGLANPALYTVMNGRPRGPRSPAAETAAEMLGAQIRRIAEAGRLRVPEERAAALVHATGLGTTLTLIATPAERRDPRLAAAAREAVIAAITTDEPAGARSRPAVAPEPTTSAGTAMSSGRATSPEPATSSDHTTSGPATSGPATSSELATTAITLRALLPQADALTTAERHLAREWLDRIIDPPHPSSGRT